MSFGRRSYSTHTCHFVSFVKGIKRVGGRQQSPVSWGAGSRVVPDTGDQVELCGT